MNPPPEIPNRQLADILTGLIIQASTDRPGAIAATLAEMVACVAALSIQGLHSEQQEATIADGERVLEAAIGASEAVPKVSVLFAAAGLLRMCSIAYQDADNSSEQR